MTDWIFIDDQKPSKAGAYLVLWSQPYSDDPSISIGYARNDGIFLDSPAGANEIIAWMELSELPDLPREGLRTRLVRRA